MCEELFDRFREGEVGINQGYPEAGSSRAGEDLKQARPGELWPKHCSAVRPSNFGSSLEDLINHLQSQEKKFGFGSQRESKSRSRR